LNSIRDRKDEDVPIVLKNMDVAKAFYRVALETLKDVADKDMNIMDISVEIGIAIAEIIQKHRIVDWQRKDNIKNRMKQEIEDYLFSLKEKYGMEIDFDHMDVIIDNSIDIAIRRY
jgi:type I restriction enzyme R subunit